MEQVVGRERKLRDAGLDNGDDDSDLYEDALPLIVFPRGLGSDSGGLGSALQQCIQRYLPRTGSMVLRGFSVNDERALRGLVAAAGELTLAPAALTLVEPCQCCARSDRPFVSRVANAWCAKRHAPQLLHPVCAYADGSPKHVWFRYETPPEPAELHTPHELTSSCVVADSREVYGRLSADLRRHVEAKDFCDVLEFAAAELSAPQRTWQEALGTTRRAEVETWCRNRGVAWRWLPGDGLQLRHVRSPSIVHPSTGARLWFSYAHLPPELLRERGQRLEYADGEPVEAALLAEVREAFAASACELELSAGDILLLDNLLVSHAPTRTRALMTAWHGRLRAGLG
ncbi:MAG: hypothetical protein RL701_2548 [Pseudomonadota bacterium]